MSRMIEQILDLTRTRLGGGLPIEPHAFDLRDAIAHIVDELRAANPSRTIRVNAPSVPGTWDRDRVEQVLSNLVSNALAHGDPAKPVSVDMRVEEGFVVIEVHNEGNPIPPQLQSVIFDPFRRGDRDSRTPQTAGLGLGLYISNEVVVAHGGRIDIQSSVAGGTTFQVRLPCRPTHKP